MIDNNILVFIENTRRIKKVIIAWNPSRTTEPMIGRRGCDNWKRTVETFDGSFYCGIKIDI